MREIFLLVVLILAIIPKRITPQNEFYRFDQSYPLRHLFSFDGSIFPKDVIDDGSVQRVVSILRSNIKQWNFIESQLLEPNINLGMPEIFIPLRHLTTTLEVLGNILFMRDELVEAKDCLERACPLMELLPVTTNEDQRLASGCFALLREVYTKLYGADGTFEPQKLLSDGDKNGGSGSSSNSKRQRQLNAASRPVTLGKAKNAIFNKMRKDGGRGEAGRPERPVGVRRSSRFRDEHHDTALDDGEGGESGSEDQDDAYADDVEEDDDNDLEARGRRGARSASDGDGDDDDDDDGGKAPDDSAPRGVWDVEAEDGTEGNDDDEQSARRSTRLGGRKRGKHPDPDSGDRPRDRDYDGGAFSVEGRFEELRLPFDHLRAELRLQADEYDGINMYPDGLSGSVYEAFTGLGAAKKLSSIAKHDFSVIKMLLADVGGAQALGLSERQWQLIYRFAVEGPEGRLRLVTRAVKLLQQTQAGLGDGQGRTDPSDIVGEGDARDPLLDLHEFGDDPDLAAAFLAVTLRLTQARIADLSAGIDRLDDNTRDGEQREDELCAFISRELRDCIDAEGGTYSDSAGFVEFDYAGTTATLEPADKVRSARAQHS